MLVARPRGLLSGVLASAPATVALVVVAYHANLLDTVRPTTPAAVSQGHRVALAAALCVAACAALRLLFAAGLDPSLRRIAGRSLMSRPAKLAVIAGAVKRDAGGDHTAQRLREFLAVRVEDREMIKPGGAGWGRRIPEHQAIGDRLARPVEARLRVHFLANIGRGGRTRLRVVA